MVEVKPNQTVRYLAWGHVNHALKRLVTKLKTKNDIGEYKTIYAMGRGGMVPTRLLSGSMGIKDVGFIDPNDPLPSLKGNYAIICDDIFDTGRTYYDVSKRVPANTIFAFLFARRNVNWNLDVYFGNGILDSSYVVFPWEASEGD